ncbi:MAG: AAA family ATPase [Oscillospiraceae bacterium]|nr:AAA family ATPase [Oscillospiraceae bacterium]
MKIEELYLAGFGRFSNKRIVLQDGLNLIFGENEAGKTTLQHFIVGMLYGFFVPTARRKTYTEDYARYEPWNSDATYGGTLICSKDERRYRIQRVFQKERESVVIFDADTGEDISEQFPYDPVTRLRDPGPTLCGVSRTVFCNTANVAQLEITPQGDFSTAWEDQILSLTETADSSLSLQAVCNALDQKAEAIGSPKRRKSPYGQAAERLEQLEQERSEAEAAAQSRVQLQRRVAELQETKNELEQQMEQAQQQKLSEQFEKAAAIRERIIEVERLLKGAEPYEDPDQLQQKIGALQQAKQTLDREERGFLKWEGRLKEINQRYLAQPIRMQDIDVLDHCLNMARNSAFSAETEQLREQLQAKQQEFISIPHIGTSDAWEALVEYESWNDEIEQGGLSAKWLVLLVGLLLVIISVVLGFQLDPFFYAGAAIGAVLMLCSIFLRSRSKERREAEDEQQRILEQYQMGSYEELKAHCETLQKREDQRIELMNEIQLLALRLQKVSEENPQRKEALDHYAARFTRDPSAVWSVELEQQVKKARELCVEFAEMSEQRSEEYEKLELHRREVSAMEQELQEQLELLGVSGVEEDDMQRLRERRKAIEQASTELELQQQLLKECLGNLTYEELQQKVQLAGRVSAQQVQSGEFDYRSVLEELAQLQGKLSTMEQLQRPIGEIMEEQQALQESCRQYQKTLDAIVLAKERLQKVSGEIRKDLTPQLGERLSRITARLTDGKYTKVLLSRDLHIRLEEPKNHQLVPLTALSRGTMDLIYLAMRMELLQVLSTDTILPLLLDDSFVQLDDSRTSNLLNYLVRNRQGQVLLLTCHSREESILKAQAVPYHRITLA